MNTVNVLKQSNLGENFIPKEFLPHGQNEYYIRNQQNKYPENHWRNLTSEEIKILVANSNNASDWNTILVTKEFNPLLIKNTNFFGLVRIGNVKNVVLDHHDLQVSVGISNSLIISCDIGDDVAIHNVHYLSHYIIGDRCILLNIDEMHTTNHAKFGNGIIKDGESEKARVWIDVMNEAGGRRIMPFDGMTSGDAYLWAKYRDDKILQEKLKEITQNNIDSKLGYYGTVGNDTVVKHSKILKDVKIGSCCYIKGANKLKNLTINSSEEESTQIGEGVELVNGIIGNGCHIFYGCKAVKFVIGNNSNLKYGARLMDSFLGDNSTISCCEVLNNLIFPAHEQHHNNSFLIASVIMGQSNVAAGATIGSNHNSRSNDNEIQAGRGFWPGLCTSVKHSSRFASFVLLSQANYVYELDVPFPFALLNNNASKDELEIMPAYWWMYNMYALQRNVWKFIDRDKRINKSQYIEFDALAPDTIEEIIHARNLLEIWTAKASLKNEKKSIVKYSAEELINIGKKLLNGSADIVYKLNVLGENIEKSGRSTLILKPYKAYHAYGEMLIYYAIKNLIEFFNSNQGMTLDRMNIELKNEREKNWVNLGGQLVSQIDFDFLLNEIKTNKANSWDNIHKLYDKFWKQYSLQKQKHAFATLCLMLETQSISAVQWKKMLEKVVIIQKYICDQVYQSRKKDYDNSFRKITYLNDDEMTATIGDLENNSFVLYIRKQSAEFLKQVEKIKKKF